MKTKLIAGAFVFAALLTLGMSCGGGGSTTTIASVDQLPQATSPVEDATTGSLSALSTKNVATTGLSLGTTTSTSFDSTSSLGACEMFNMTKQSINTAAQGDLILCYITTSFAAADAAGLADANSQAIDIYDGDYHVFGLDFTGSVLCGENSDEACTGAAGEDSGPDKVKFKVTRSGGLIRGFEMFACSNDVQDQYISQTISGTDFTMISKDSRTQGAGTSAQEATVTGTLSSTNAGRFSGSKTITMDMSFAQGSNRDFWGHFVYVQEAASGTMNGVMGGSNFYQGASYNFANQILGSVQLIDANTNDGDYDIGLLAMGDGAVRGCVQGGSSSDITLATTCTDNNTNAFDDWKDDFTDAWDGDVSLVPTRGNVTGSDYYANVADGSLPTATQPTISAFADDQLWDCSDDVEATINFAELNVTFDSCSPLQLGHEHINCWQIAGEGASANEMPGALDYSATTIDTSASNPCANPSIFLTTSTSTLGKTAEDENSFLMSDGNLVAYTGTKSSDGTFSMVSDAYTSDTGTGCVLSLVTTITGTTGNDLDCNPSSSVVSTSSGSCASIIGAGASCTLTYSTATCSASADE